MRFPSIISSSPDGSFGRTSSPEFCSYGILEQISDVSISNTFADMMRQLRGLATNVNQIAHIANGTGQLPVVVALEKLGKEIEKLRSEEERRWQSIRQLISQQNLMER